MLIRYQRWRRRRTRRATDVGRSWLECKGSPDRTPEETAHSLLLFKCLRVGLVFFPVLQDDIVSAVLAPQSTKRFWSGTEVDISPRWITLRYDFAPFLEDETHQSFGRPQEVFAWLRDCQYISDTKLFGECDHWQMPSEFATRRKGDCEDFALWTWNRLARCGIDARLVLGKWRRPNVATQHAWVALPWSGQNIVLEGTWCDGRSNLVEESEARAQYLPFFSVNSKCQVYWHG